MIPVKVVLVKKTGKCYLYNGEHRDVVVCKGEVSARNGMSLTHGPDKKFKRDAVSVIEYDLTESLVQKLRSQGCPDCENGSGWTRHLGPNNDEVVEACETCCPPPKVEPVPEPDRKAWVEWSYEDGEKRARLTKYADEQLMKEGYGAAMDGLGNYFDEDMLADAAMDCAMEHYELTREGVRTGCTPCREAAADMIHEGMLKALNECKAKGRKVSMDR